MVVLSRKSCSCGCNTPTIKLLGRNNQKIKVCGQIIDFDEIIYILEKKGYEGSYYIEILKEPTDKLFFYVSDMVNIEKFENTLNKLISVSYKIVKLKEIVLPKTNTGKIKHIQIK